MSHSTARHHKIQHKSQVNNTTDQLDSQTTVTTTTAETTDAVPAASAAAQLRSSASPTTASNTVADDGYMIRAEERLVVDKETVNAGVAQLNKFVTTEHVYTTVPVVKEHAVLHTEPITAADNINVDKIGSAHYEMPLSEERAVASKQAVAVEKVMLRKDLEQTTEVVVADLKKENVSFKPAVDEANNAKTRKTYTKGVDQ